jgi:hypothetical protein
MGPGLIGVIRAGAFDPEAWTAEEKTGAALDFDGTLAAIAAHADVYPKLLNAMSEADFRAEVELFGTKGTQGAFIVSMVLSGCAAYRMQLFLYLKACGREELNTMNLWAGMDAPAPA